MSKEVVVKNLHTKRIVTYWLARGVGYGFPLTYFFVVSTVTQSSSRLTLPILVSGIFLVIKLTGDIIKWTKTWQPSFWKGLLVALPKLILFSILISIGLLLQWLVETQIDTSFAGYFETVIVLFGGQAVGSVIEAFHLKYYQLDLMDKGYVLGVVNK